LRRIPLVAPSLLAGAILFVGCGVVSGSNKTPTPTAVPATATPEALDLTVFRGFISPIKGGCLPAGDQLMPNAPRVYRGGIHEGVDLYDYDNCAKIGKGTAIVAAKDGVVIRADHDYQPLSEAQLAAANKRIAEGQANDPDVLDLFRGRQVWIDHGKGIVTRYAHTSDVAANIRVGDTVRQGDVIAFVGDSGTPESISDPGAEDHLHFELRTGETFLGEGLPAAEVRALYERLFTPVDTP
jgi:murein DD-endopeptidase MepM/ murein hydrolase activator NlpD